LETLQILLVGGRQIPNFLGVMLLRPDRVHFLVSKDDKNALDNLYETLAKMEGLVLPDKSQLPDIDANDYQANIAALERILSDYPNARVSFNLTCSSKVMAFAAYEVARHEDIKTFYVDTAKGRIIWLKGKEVEEMPIRISIEQYLMAYGRKPKYKYKKDEDIFNRLTFSQKAAAEAANVLASGCGKYLGFLQRIRNTEGNGPRKVSISSEIDINLATLLADLGIVDYSKDNRHFIIRSNEDWNFFKGDWLEIFVWHEVKKLQEQATEPFFDDIAIGLEIPMEGAKKEIDLACIYRAQLIHCSCKTGRDSFNTKHLDELSAISSLIGGNFCSRVFITDRMLPNNAKSFLDQAKQRKIVVVTGKELPKIGEILKKQAENPDYPRI
jgi:hypothetical protein